MTKRPGLDTANISTRDGKGGHLLFNSGIRSKATWKCTLLIGIDITSLAAECRNTYCISQRASHTLYFQSTIYNKDLVFLITTIKFYIYTIYYLDITNYLDYSKYKTLNLFHNKNGEVSWKFSIIDQK